MINKCISRHVKPISWQPEHVFTQPITWITLFSNRSISFRMNILRFNIWNIATIFGYWWDSRLDGILHIYIGIYIAMKLSIWWFIHIVFLPIGKFWRIYSIIFVESSSILVVVEALICLQESVSLAAHLCL